MKKLLSLIKKQKRVVHVYIFGLIIIFFVILWKLFFHQNTFAFTEVTNNMKLRTICDECYITVEVIPSQNDHLELHFTQDALMKSDPFYNLDVGRSDNIQIAEYKFNGINLLLTRRYNMGSGNGAFYNVFKINQNESVSELKLDIYACQDPKFNSINELVFKNEGSHCDWLDTSSGEPKIIRVKVD